LTIAGSFSRTQHSTGARKAPWRPARWSSWYQSWRLDVLWKWCVRRHVGHWHVCGLL